MCHHKTLTLTTKLKDQYILRIGFEPMNKDSPVEYLMMITYIYINM